MNPTTLIRWFVAATVLIVCALGGRTHGQQPAAYRQPALNASGDAVPGAAPAPAAGNDLPTQPVPPPADPQPADWGGYVQPVSPPVAQPVLEYAITAPPSGIIQPDVPGVYRTPMAEAEDFLRRDATLRQAIDLWRPDGLAPVGVLQDATLRNGQFLVSYRFNYQAFEGNFVGSHHESNASVAANYPFVPANMSTNRNLLILQYGLTDDFTFFGELPFQHSRLDYAEAGGGDFRTGFTNPADITLSTMYVLWRGNRQQIHTNLGMSFPVGFLDSQSDLPSSTLPNLPYAIRTGSGTFDILPGLTYRGQSDLWTWGVQSIGTVRTGSNRLDYRLGDRVDLTGWLARRWGERISTSARLDYQWWGNVRNADPRLNQALSPMNDPTLQGGNRIDLLFGLNLFLPNTRLPGQRLSVEAGAPIFQSLSGPQLGTNWLMTVGWNWVY